VPADANGPKISGFWGGNGYANYWMNVNQFLDAGSTFYHEFGHECLYGDSMYRGEAESIVHVPVSFVFALNELHSCLNTFSCIYFPIARSTHMREM
jgi:hypothetical protein